MNRVLRLCAKSRRNLSMDAVHDLRVALRRCRSMADDFRTLDSDKDWNRMKRAGRRLFKRLGNLRDSQVLGEWVGKLAANGDLAAQKLREHQAEEDKRLRADAVDALDRFDSKEWKTLSAILPQRAERVPLDGLAFQHIAIEQWNEVYELHRHAMRTRSKIALHRLRIGAKRFRYTVENFLPQLHAQWRDDLKAVQDWLGEIHDLDVLWSTALRLRVFPDADSRAYWQARIAGERKQRLDQYRQKMLGPQSLWKSWRAALPQGKEWEEACIARLGAWASFLTPDFAEAQRVAGLALRLYDNLLAQGLVTPVNTPRLRYILHGAVLMHEVGQAKRKKGYHKASYRLISQLSPPEPWQPHELQMAALVARYHRGATPKPDRAEFSELPAAERQGTLLLAGILRLASVFDRAGAGVIQRFRVEHAEGSVVIQADGYTGEEPLASKLAAARHLLEIAIHQPILIVPAVQVELKPLSRSANPTARTYAA